MARGGVLSAGESILLAAAGLDSRGEFSEWDLTVAAHRNDPKRFAMRGYPLLPDHKRVSMEIMCKKKVAPVTQGWLRRIRRNTYQVMPLGRLATRVLCGDEALAQ